MAVGTTRESRTLDGYAQANYHMNGQQFAVYPHVLSFQEHNGELVQGMQIDHVCHIPDQCEGECAHRRCINPEHLKQVTSLANLMRSTSPSARNAVSTACPEGHPYDAVEASTGIRRCTICRARDKRSHYKRHGAEANRRRAEKMRTDPEYRERRLAANRSSARLRSRERYANDPEFRERRRAEALARYHAKKAG